MKKAVRWLEASVLLAIFFFAFLLRVTLMLYHRSYIFPDDDLHWAYGYEAGRIAASIAHGDGFSSPFPEPSGPTAWLAPIYPYLIAAVFKIFGIYSRSSAIVILLFQSLLSSLTCLLAYLISQQLFHSLRSAVLTAALWAVYPASIWFSINYIWDDCLLALAIATTFLLLLHASRNPSLKLAFAVGLMMGFSLLISPVALPFYALALGYVGWRARAKGKPALKLVTVAGATIGLLLLPWLIRNYVTFKQIGLIKAGFGVELRIGNNPGATGMFTQMHRKRLHPSLVPEEFVHYVRVGEVNYNRYCLAQALAYIRGNPMQFVRLSLKRLGYFWLGDWGEEKEWLGNLSKGIPYALMIKKLSYVVPVLFLAVGLFTAWRRKQDITLPLLLLLVFPLPYYVTHVLVKYRYYIDVVILVLASYGFFAMVDFTIGSVKKLTSRKTIRVN